MAKVTITYACGHEGVVELFGRSADRERRAAWLASDICPDCAAQKRREKAMQLAADAEADGLPKLTGSEKQVIWAEQLRADFFAAADKRRAEAVTRMDAARETLSEKDSAQSEQMFRDWDNGVSYIAANKVQSSWWIETRRQDVSAVIQDVVDKDLPNDISSPSNDQAAISEATLTPENPSHGGSVEITVDKDYVAAKYLKDDDFRTLVKSLKFTWDHDHTRWMRVITPFSGSAEDRAAELANLLLRNGFSVLCWDESVRKKAVDATYTPECSRWVSVLVAGDYKGWFSISITDRNQALFDEARRIKGARIYHSKVIAPASRHKEVFDFAECNGYCISKGAKALAENYIAQQENAVNAAVPQKETPAPDRLNEILQSSSDILPDLEDD